MLSLVTTSCAGEASHQDEQDNDTNTNTPTTETVTTLNVASYNVRYDASADYKSGDGWSSRKQDVIDIIYDYDFDVVGTQEANAKQLTEMKNMLINDYLCIAHSYGGTDGKAHNCATFFKRARFTLLDKGTFWYSPTPEEESIGWDADDLRLCHWGKLRDKQTKQEFYFFNSHLYWKLEEARSKSGGVHTDMIKKIAGDEPVISVGDFNSKESTTQIKQILTLLKDARNSSKKAAQGMANTNLGGGVFQGKPVDRIDYIFVSKEIEVETFRTIENRCSNGHYPSDHLPIVSKIKIK